MQLLLPRSLEQKNSLQIYYWHFKSFNQNVHKSVVFVKYGVITPTFFVHAFFWIICWKTIVYLHDFYLLNVLENFVGQPWLE